MPNVGAYALTRFWFFQSFSLGSHRHFRFVMYIGVRCPTEVRIWFVINLAPNLRSLDG